MSDTKENDPQRVWKIIEKVGVAMFVTHHDEALDGRPLQAYADQDKGLIYFMTDSKHVIGDTEANARVLLSFASRGANDFLALDGIAGVSDDRAKIRELWTHWAEAFWDGPDDPDIRIITVTPNRARYWDGPNMVITTLAIATSAITGKEPNVGTAGDVKM